MKPIYIAAAAVLVAAILFAAGFGVGRNSKQLPVYVNPEALTDSIRLVYEEKFIQARQEERDLYQHKIDSAAQASKKPIKRQVQDAAHILTDLPNDSIAAGLLADPEQ